MPTSAPREVPTPLDMPQVRPWWPCRALRKSTNTYAVHGFAGLWFMSGAPYVERREWLKRRGT